MNERTLRHLVFFIKPSCRIGGGGHAKHTLIFRDETLHAMTATFSVAIDGTAPPGHR
jgi:hypothetical protein